MIGMIGKWDWQFCVHVPLRSSVLPVSDSGYDGKTRQSSAGNSGQRECWCDLGTSVSYNCTTVINTPGRFYLPTVEWHPLKKKWWNAVVVCFVKYFIDSYYWTTLWAIWVVWDSHVGAKDLQRIVSSCSWNKKKNPQTRIWISFPMVQKFPYPVTIKSDFLKPTELFYRFSCDF